MALDRSRQYMWVAVSGAVLMTVFAIITVLDAGDQSATSSPTPLWQVPASEQVSPARDDAATPTDISSSSLIPSSRQPARRPAMRPVEVLAGLQTTIRTLVDRGQLSRDAGKELSERLDEAAGKLGDGGESKELRKKLREFAEKLVHLREEDKIADFAYQTLAAQLSLLVQSFSAG